MARLEAVITIAGWPSAPAGLAASTACPQWPVAQQRHAGPFISAGRREPARSRPMTVGASGPSSASCAARTRPGRDLALLVLSKSRGDLQLGRGRMIGSKIAVAWPRTSTLPQGTVLVSVAGHHRDAHAAALVTGCYGCSAGDGRPHAARPRPAHALQPEERERLAARPNEALSVTCRQRASLPALADEGSTGQRVQLRRAARTWPDAAPWSRQGAAGQFAHRSPHVATARRAAVVLGHDLPVCAGGPVSWFYRTCGGPQDRGLRGHVTIPHAAHLCRTALAEGIHAMADKPCARRQRRYVCSRPPRCWNAALLGVKSSHAHGSG